MKSGYAEFSGSPDYEDDNSSYITQNVLKLIFYKNRLIVFSIDIKYVSIGFKMSKI